MLVWAAAFFALLTTGHPSGTPALIARAEPVRVMAFGDSITAGVGAYGQRTSDGGYRGSLEKLLAEHGYHAVFVGSRNDFSESITERAHEGWPGYVLRSFPSDPGPGQLYGKLALKAMQENDPDVVLLMAGTNDLLRHEGRAEGYTLTNIVQSMDLLLDQIVHTKPNVFVIVAPVVESPRVQECTAQAFAGFGGCGGTAGLKALVEEYAQRGYRVSFAPAMLAAVPRDAAHFPDGIHPSGAGGYAAVAAVWLRAIEDITQPAQTAVAASATQQ